MTATNPRVGTTFGKYKIIGVVGKGGMGEVYEAYDNDIGRTVALKIIKSQYADDRNYRLRFERESRVAAKLQEPHVIPIHGVGEIDGCLFIDMRLVRGTDLQTILAERPLDPERAVAIISQIAAALDAAHAEGLLHRDVKPQNILVTPADFAYLVDFGIAEVIGDTRLTQAGARIGSWAYMAPERFADKQLTSAVDIYSLACVLYECLTGAMPFATSSQQAVIAAHLTMPPPRPSVTNPSVPSTFDEVIARGMAKEPDDRYGSAGALGRAATRALRGTGTQTGPTEAVTQWASRPPVQPRPAVQPRPSVPPRPSAPQYFPPPAPAPAPVTYSERPGRSPWVVPAVIVAVALVLGAVGIVIGLVAKMNSTPAPTAEPTSSTTFAVVTSTGTLSRPTTSTESLPSGNIPPPFLTGPDASPDRRTCDVIQLPDRTGFATRAGRGSARTSCVFADSVLKAYWTKYDTASLTSRTVSASGAVACSTVPGASCDPTNSANFLMQCAGDGSNPWIKCTGGSEAVVYLW